MLKAGFQLRPCWTRCVARGFAGARSVPPSPASVLWLRDGGRVISGPGRTSSFRLGVGTNECVLVFRRRFAGGGGEGGEELRNKRRATVMFISALGVLVLSLSYAAVPLYRLFCQATSYGGTVLERDDADLSGMKKRADRKIRIAFNADTAANLTWSFRPQQTEITVSPGETALAFYTATNKTDKPIDGIATYNVIPFEVGQYFNKIQCFCFEEQRLNPGEQVDMPVFFYIDPEFAEDPKMEYIKDVTLSYTFFEAKEGLNLPMPAFMNKS